MYALDFYQDSDLKVAGVLLDKLVTVGRNPDNEVVLKDVVLGLGDGQQNFVEVTVDQGVILLTATGLAATLDGSVELLNIPGVSLNAPVSLDINNTMVAVHKTFEIDFDRDGNITPDETIAIDLPAGPFLRVQGGTPSQPLTLTILGQELAVDIRPDQPSDRECGLWHIG